MTASTPMSRTNNLVAVSSVVTNWFSAAGSALGYLAQVEYALFIALQRMDTDDSLRLSLETVDDITFEADGHPRELWQQAVYDDNRAFLQRSRWQREQLLSIGELDVYDRRPAFHDRIVDVELA